MPFKLTSLRYPLEKTLEAEHFLSRVAEATGLQFQFELNAFLSASRSVSFVLQNAMADVPGFALWYEHKQNQMRSDAAMRFFVELRNVSQKQGPVSYVGTLLPGGRWAYNFWGITQDIPAELAGVDIVTACANHLRKLAKVLVECTEVFPFESCPSLAFTEAGMAKLGYSFADVEAAVGLPAGWTDVAGIPASEKLRILSREIEPLDFNELERLASGDLRPPADNDPPPGLNSLKRAH